jgi:hypothetical protein
LKKDTLWLLRGPQQEAYQSLFFGEKDLKIFPKKYPFVPFNSHLMSFVKELSIVNGSIEIRPYSLIKSFKIVIKIGSERFMNALGEIIHKNRSN